MKVVVLLAAFLVAAITSDAALAQEKVLRFAHQRNLFMAPVFVAREKGWFNDALGKVGYKMEPHEINVGPAVAEAMAAEQIDVGQLGLAVIVTAAGRGLPAKIVVNTGIAGEGVVVRSDSEITKMADLRGKIIAIPAKGNMQDFIVRRGLEEAGLDPSKDVRFIEVPAPDQKQALYRREVDAITLWEPLVTDAVLGGGRLLATGQDIFPGHENELDLRDHPGDQQRSKGRASDRPDRRISTAVGHGQPRGGQVHIGEVPRASSRDHRRSVEKRLSPARRPPERRIHAAIRGFPVQMGIHQEQALGRDFD